MKILTLNNIAQKGLDTLPEGYEYGPDIENPDAIIVRSADMHEYELPQSVRCIGRAGAGVNNIPTDKLAEANIPVFNAPGANAGSVKELVVAAMIIASRNLVAAHTYTKALTSEGPDLKKEVESGKKQFAGHELAGKTIGVIGLGAIGARVARAALDLNMQVIGYDPAISNENAQALKADGIQITSELDELFKASNFITVHVPLIDATRGIVSAEALEQAPEGVVVLNFARDGIVDDAAVLAALDSGKVAHYATDFPTAELIAHERVITFPHLGASTEEAEENSATMALNSIVEYLENDKLINAVNMPNTQ